MAYDTDPDIAAFLTGGKSSSVGQIPTKDVAPKKSAMSGKNPQLQPDENIAPSDYLSDPDVSAFLSVLPKKSKLTQTPNQFNQFVGKALQTFQEPIQQLKGIGEAGATALTGAVAAPLGAATGLVANLRSGQYGTPAGIRAGEEQAQNLQQQMTYQPKTVKGQEYVQDLQKMFEASKLPPVGVPEVAGFATLGSAATQQAIGAPAQMKAGFQKLKGELPTVKIERGQSSAMQSGGAAAAVPENVLRGNIDSALSTASPELQAHIQSKPVQSVNIPALETRALEEKHGVNLTTGQRTGDTQLYSQEWNKRGETEALGGHFNEQPVQVLNAFEVSKQRHAPDIPSNADASELGQNMINGLAEKDKVRTQTISEAYKALQDANGGQFPIDIQSLDANIKKNLTSQLKTSHLSPAISSDLSQFYANPTFEAYEALRTNLANEMRSSSNGNARAAAYIVRQELENLPIFGENTGSPQAIQLKALADNARKLVRERAEVLKSNPAYRAAVKEAGTLEEATSQGESLNAEKFHKKYVAGGTPEAIRRMKAELEGNDIANQSIAFSELERAKNAAVNASGRNLIPEQYAKFLKQHKSVLRETLSPEAMQDVMELGLITSKIGMPKTGTFNYSNTYSGMLADMAKQGLAGAGEAKLATMTGGASIPAVHFGKQWMQKLNKEGFAKEALNPYGGLTKD